MRFLRSTGSSLPAHLLLAIPLLLSTTSADATPDLKIEITKPVQCDRKTQNGDTIFVHYRGTLVDGTEFDSSYGRGHPLSFTLGQGRVIRGWDLGLLDMCTWEQRRLTIPPELAYGDAAMGKIPAGSTLVFDTELRGIEGVSAGPSPTATEPAPVAATSSVSGDEANGECRLLGPFSLLVQAALGALALLSLVYKRWRERPRRPVKIWVFDVSKQVFGAIILHVLNLLLSMLSSGRFDSAKSTTYIASSSSSSGGGEREQPNGCSFYLLNLAIDTTIGIPILVFFLYVLHALFLHTALADPPASLSSGNYGHPPNVRWWAKQFLIYCIGLILMKLCVLLLFQLFPWLGWVGDWALRWTEGDERLQIAFVMFIFPLIMNAAQYWIIDSFIKDRTGEGYEYQEVGAEGEDGEDENEGLIGLGGGGMDERAEGEFAVGDGEAEPVSAKEAERVSAKEANPTPTPAYRVEGGSSSSSSRGSSRGYDREEGKKSN